MSLNKRLEYKKPKDKNQRTKTKGQKPKDKSKNKSKKQIMSKHSLASIIQMSRSSAFSFEMPLTTFECINDLAKTLKIPLLTSTHYVASTGSATGAATGASTSTASASAFATNDGFETVAKRKHMNMNMNMNYKLQKPPGLTGPAHTHTSEQWETIRSFQTTTLEQKTGIDKDLSDVRSMLNKLSDKTYLDVREQLVAKIANIDVRTEGNAQKLGLLLYTLCSSNKFYSKLFADLFTDLAGQYKWLRRVFREQSDHLSEQYSSIQYIDADVDYDGFCAMNKANDTRRALTMFYVNLARNGFAKKEAVVGLLFDILQHILELIQQDNKRNEVDELTEYVAILFDPAILNEVANEQCGQIRDTIIQLSVMKTKDCKSLSNKTIFKYMDVVDNHGLK